MLMETKRDTEVPGQFLGYALQEQRVLFRLLSSDPKAYVSLEVFDDVGVNLPDGSQISEQGKSFQSSNPVSDRARDLWKTINNWIDNIKSGQANPEVTCFVIYSFQPHHGEIVDKFSSAKSEEQAKAAYECAREILWGMGPHYPLKKNVSDSIEPYVTKFFTSDEKIIIKLIQNFSLECGSGNTSGDLKDLFRKSLIPEDLIDDTMKFSLGWVKESIDSKIEQGKPAIISGEEFRAKVAAFVRARDRRTILVSYSTSPRQDEVESTVKTLRTYIKQLDLIDCDDDERFQAVNDFMRAEYDRTIWSVKGFVDEESLDDFENGLFRTWENIKKKIDIDLNGRDDVIRGKRIYIDCSLHKAKLEGIDVPDHFTPGSFHSLSDTERIGWHPEYKNLLKNSASKE